MWGGSPAPSEARPQAAVIQPAWRPMTSRTKTWSRCGHRGDVVAGFAHRGGDVLGDRAEPRAAVGERQVVVDGLGGCRRRPPGSPAFRNLETFQAVSMESLPPL